MGGGGFGGGGLFFSSLFFFLCVVLCSLFSFFRCLLASADSGTASRAARDVFTRGKPGYAVSGITDKRVRAEIMALRLESTQSAERWERVDQYSLFNTNHDTLWN